MSPAGVPAARAIQNVALETSPGTVRSRARSRCPPRIADPAVVGLDGDAEGVQRALGVVAGGDRLDDRRVAVGLQAGQEHGALHLRARNFGMVRDAAQPRAVDRQRRAPVERRDGRAHPGQAAR